MFRSAGLAQPMRSPRPSCFSPPTTQATSQEQNCLWTAASPKCRPLDFRHTLARRRLGWVISPSLRRAFSTGRVHLSWLEDLASPQRSYCWAVTHSEGLTEREKFEV